MSALVTGTRLPLQLLTAFESSTFILQAIIMGTVFYKSPENTVAYFSRGGVLFLYAASMSAELIHIHTHDLLLSSALLFAALASMAEIPALFAQRPIVVKHYKAAMYHPFVEAAALTIVDIPITFVTIMVFGVILYYLVGLANTAGQFL